MATPLRVRLLAFLYHIALGASYRIISHQFAIGISNVGKIVHDVTSAILSHMWNAYIRLPTLEEAQRSIKEWKGATGIPGIVGAIDGTHIAIKKPSNCTAPEANTCEYTIRSLMLCFCSLLSRVHQSSFPVEPRIRPALKLEICLHISKKLHVTRQKLTYKLPASPPINK